MTFRFDACGRNDFEDEQNVRDRHWHARAGEVVLDVGAAIGSYTLPALAAGATVVALCPQRAHRKALESNVDMNDGFRERFRSIGVGLYDQAGWLRFDGSAYRFQEHQPDPVGDEDIEVARLDDLDLGVDRIDLVKIDVEGAEFKALRAGRETILRHRPRILVENHLFFDASLEAQVGYFLMSLDVGYRVHAEPYLSGTVSHSFYEVRP